jgi:PPOX class probable F420-dependent enzyme
MSVLTQSARAVIESDRPAHLVTLNPDGSPHVTLAWVALNESDEILIASLRRFRKLRNIERDPRVSLSIEGLGLHPIGLREYLVVYGTARIEEGGAAELLRRLARVYMGPDANFPPDPNPPPGWITRITPQRLGGAGPWLQGE